MPGMPTDTITWGPWAVAAGQEFSFRFTATVTTSPAVAGETITNTVDYSSDNAGDGSADAVFEVVGPDIQIVSPTDGQIFTTDQLSVTIPVEVSTENFVIPTDGHWHLWVDGDAVGPVFTYTTDVALLLGTHVISAEFVHNHVPCCGACRGKWCRGR